MVMQNNFNSLLKELLKRYGISVRQYAEMLGVSYQSIYQKINRGTVKAEDIDQLAKILQVDISVYVVEENGNGYILPLVSHRS